MAGESVVGALRVVLGMDTGSFEDGAKKASEQASEFGKMLAAVFGGTTLSNIVERLFDTITHAFKEGIKHAFEFADQMGKTAQKVGISVEQLSGLRVAAELSDVSMESLSTAMGKLSKNMVDAANKGGNAREQFEALGLSASQIKDKSPAEVLALIADRFANAEDGAKKTSAALNLLGKGGKELIPLLNEGGKSLKEFSDLAEKMGLIVSKDTAAQAQRFNDDLKILKLSFEGLTNQVVAQLLPTLLNLSGQFVETAKSGDATKAAAERIANALREFIITAAQTVGLVSDLWKALVLLDQLTDTTKAPESFEEMADRVNKLGEAFKNISPHLLAIREALSKPLELTVRKPTELQELGDVGNKVRQELDKLSLQTRILKGDFDALAPGFPAMAASLDLTAKNGQSLATTAAGLSGQLATLNTAMQGVRAAQLTEENLLPWDSFNKKMIALNATMASGKLDVETYGRASMKIAADLQASWGQTAQAIVSPMAQAFKDLATMNKNYAGIAKAAAIGEATVNTYLAATKALASVPPPFNYAAAAAVLAAGLVNVAKISATNFATGGSFKVGGQGGIDSQLVAFNATPGEMVDIRKPGQQTAATANEITVNLRGRELYNRDMIRDLFSAINAGTRDGYRLKLAEV